MTTKELKKLYVDTVVAESFGERMRKHFEQTVSQVVELSNGYLIAIEKPTIEKNFCFGYSDSRYDTEDFDRANAMANHARTNEDYFLEENRKKLTSQIDALFKYNCYTRIHYCNAPKDTKIRCIEFVSDYDKWNMSEETKAKLEPLSESDRQLIVDAYREEQKAFDKRLASYLKRYGLSKVNSWSYWQDE